MNSQPTAPLERDDAVMTLVTDEKYELTLREAEDLVSRAEASVTGMASHGLGTTRTVWVTHMSTQQGKFVIELD